MNREMEKRLAKPKNNIYVWCTYRDWSFHVLEGLLDLEPWRCGLVITTGDCLYPVERYEAMSIPVLRLDDPKQDLSEGRAGFNALKEIEPSAIFFLGWSWMVPAQLQEMAINLTLHPGKLPRGRGGSPIQNQIRDGDEWTWANLIGLVDEMDAGPVFEKEKIELHGDTADAVWSRMVAAGQVTSRRFLNKLANGEAYATAQDSHVTPEVKRRVTPQSARILHDQLDAKQIYNIIRAHQESDPNSYVVPAWVDLAGRRLYLERASMYSMTDQVITLDKLKEFCSGKDDACFVACLDINNGKTCLVMEGKDGVPVYITQVRMTRME